MSSAAVPPQRTFLGHPLGLYVLFFTEMWERFSYYGMRALLILYMVNYFRWDQKDASTVYKVYTSFVYVTPILGGYLADRYLGNRKAVIIGAILMAIGHFLMAFETIQIFYSALIFLILGNGFFKPNMSVQVGRLYPANDGRRDGAYTIFYMGINLGALLAPVVCGWLMENTVGGYHSGFTMAGIGMVLGLIIYLAGQPFVKEIDPSTPPVTPLSDAATPQATQAPLTEEEAAQTPSALGFLYGVAPALLSILGVFALLIGIGGVGREVLTRYKLIPPVDLPENLAYWVEFWNALMLVIGGICLLLVARICREVQGGVRDRVLAILALGIFVIFFWAAFEQAGNVQNLWADKNTNRYLTDTPPQPSLFPDVQEDPAGGEAAAEQGAAGEFLTRFVTMFQLKPRPAQNWTEWFTGSLNPIPTTWFQSINAAAIVLIAPVFAWLWLWLDRRGQQPSIPMKMTLGLLLMSGSMAVMMAAANQEAKQTTVQLQGPLPDGVGLDKENRLGTTVGEKHVPFHAGLIVNEDNNTLRVQGTLPDTEAYRIMAATAPPGFQEAVENLKKKSQEILLGGDVKSVEERLAEVPPGFDLKYAGIKKSIVDFDPATKILTARSPLAEKEVKGLLVAAGDSKFRDTIEELHIKSSEFRVSPWWLFWSYILATLGELCLSPVGLSMVSKLAPAKFATMLMGVWLLTSSFGNFAAGALGEIWGTIPPVQFFLLSTAIVGAAALVLFFLVRILVRAMHGVN